MKQAEKERCKPGVLHQHCEQKQRPYVFSFPPLLRRMTTNLEVWVWCDWKKLITWPHFVSEKWRDLLQRIKRESSIPCKRTVRVKTESIVISTNFLKLERRRRTSWWSWHCHNCQKQVFLNQRSINEKSRFCQKGKSVTNYSICKNLHSPIGKIISYLAFCYKSRIIISCNHYVGFERQFFASVKQ